MMMVEAFQDNEEGVKVGGRALRDIRYADDQAMLSSTEQGLQETMNKLCIVAEEYGMRVNVNKTKVMRVSKHPDGRKLNIVVNRTVLEQVTSFKYLGSTITEDGRCESEIDIRIAIAKAAFTKRRELLSRAINIYLKKKIIKTMAWSILLYGCETWTLKKEEIKQMEACEMWFWRRLLKIKSTDKISNEEVLRRVDEQRTLIDTIYRRKRKWIGHVVRGDGLMKLIMEGRMEGSFPPGKPRIGMLDMVKPKFTKKSKKNGYAIMKRVAMDRERWREWVPSNLP